MLDESDAESLLVLLKASAKEQVAKSCELAFDCMVGTSDISMAVCSESLPPEAGDEERRNLLTSLSKLYKGCLGLDAIGMANEFPPTFHKQLRDLLIRIMLQRQQDWSSKLAKSRAGIPWLRSFKCFPIEVDDQQNSSVAMMVEVGSGEPSGTPKTLSLTVKSSNLTSITGKMRQLADQLEAIANR